MFGDAKGFVYASMGDEEVDVGVVKECGGIEKGEAIFFFTNAARA